MTPSRYYQLSVLVLAMGLPVVATAQSISTGRTLVDIGPIGSECRVSTCIEVTAQRAPICAVQALDISGSMNTGGRFEAALAGIEQFIDSLDADKGDRVGVVTFSGPGLRFGATPQENPGPALINVLGDPPSADYATLKESLALVGTTSVSSLTPVAAAIESGLAALDHCPSGSFRVLILSTDGLPNWHDDVQCTVTPLASTVCTEAAVEAAAQGKAGGVHVVSIGIDLSASDPSDAFGISVLRDVATSPQDANFFNTADGLSQSDIFSHLSRSVASPAEVTFFEPLPDSCWAYVPGTTTGVTVDDPVPGLIGNRQTLAWNVGVVADGATAQLCYSMGFDPACGEPPTSLVVQAGGETLWQLTDGRRESQPVNAAELPNIQACQIVFPVELTDFRAISSPNEVSLVWQTASETDNAGFGIERSTGTGAFQEIGFVPGAGASLVKRDYMYRDRDLVPGSYRYRLRQVDFDGSFEYSHVVEARVELPASHFMSPVFPNPASREVRFDLSVARTQRVAVELVDVTGRVVLTVPSIMAAEGDTESLAIHVAEIPAGLYAVHIRGEFFAISRFIVVAR